MSDQAYEMASESAQPNAVNQGTQEGQSAFEGNTDANNSLPGRVLEGDELRTALIERLEHVLSKEYLASDPLLVSRLSADFYAPISIIEELPIIKSLTSDSKLINSALRASKLIVVDEARQAARPAIQLSQRNTIILRDIPENTTEQDVRALLAGTNFEASITELKPDFGNTFFIKFATEDVVTDAFAHLRKQTLGGKPVQARIKSEHLLKSVYYGSSNFQSSSTPSSPQFYQNNGIRPSYSNPSPRGGSRGFKANDGSFRPTYDNSKRSPQWSNNNSSNTRKKEYSRGGGKPFDGKGARGRNGIPRHGKKGYPGGRGLPTAPSHWPPLSGEENAEAQAQTAPVAGGPSGAQQHDGSQPIVTTTTATATTTTTTTTNSQPEQQHHDTQPKSADSNASATAQSNPGSGTSTPSGAPPTVATAWAVSNSAVKQPPPKRVPNNAPPKKHNKQKQQPQASQPQQNQKSQNNSSGNSGGKWKEAKGGKRYKGGGKRGGDRRNNSSNNNNNSNTSNTVTNSSSNTAQATTAAPTTNDHKTDDASHAQSNVQQPVTSIGSDSQPAPTSSPASGSKVSYADVVRPTSTPDQPKLKPEASANPPSD